MTLIGRFRIVALWEGISFRLLPQARPVADRY